MKIFAPILTEGDAALIASALDCFVRQQGLASTAPVAALVAKLDASMKETENGDIPNLD